MNHTAEEQPLTFLEHVHELRRRLMWPALALMVSGSLGYIFHAAIIAFLKQPLHQNLYYTTPAGNFNFIMKICVITGIVVAIPLLVYNLVTFIEPAIQKTIRKKSITTVSLLSLVLGVAGAAFAYYVVVPMSLRFFMGFSISGIKPLISADDYLSFILTCILSFILMFQLPLLILFINHIKPLQPRKLLKYERHVIVGSLVVALVLPFTYDPLTQFLIAAPIIILYNLSVVLVWLANRGVRKREAARARAEALSKLRPILPPAPKVPVTAQANFTAPTMRQLAPTARPVARRPILDVSGGVLPRQNFLDLRPIRTVNSGRSQ